MDNLSPERRSWLMSRIAGKNTKPELVVRRLVWGMGYRYRLHRSDLPGKPDLAFGPRKKAIFVHGCFWHQHKGCKYATLPKTEVSFWQHKFARNVERDAGTMKALRLMGWRSLVIWQCELRNLERVAKTIGKFLNDGKK